MFIVGLHVHSGEDALSTMCHAPRMTYLTTLDGKVRKFLERWSLCLSSPIVSAFGRGKRRPSFLSPCPRASVVSRGGKTSKRPRRL